LLSHSMTGNIIGDAGACSFGKVLASDTALQQL